MGMVISNDGSTFVPTGTAVIMTIDATNNQVETEVTALMEADHSHFQIQSQVADGAFFTWDGADPTSTIRVEVDDKFSEVWSRATLRKSRWSRAGSVDGVLFIQPLE